MHLLKKVSYSGVIRNIFYHKEKKEEDMFVYTVRASGIRYFLLVILTLAVLVGSIVIGNAQTLMASADGIDLGGVGEHEGRIAFIKRFGYEVDETSETETAFTMPSDFDRVITDYNELQRRQGLDLTKYANKKVTRYTYEVKNYDGYEGKVYANLFVHRGRVIGCDISSADPTGFVEPMIKLTAK